MALEMQHLFVRGAPQGGNRVDIFNIGSNSMRPKYNLELSYIGYFSIQGRLDSWPKSSCGRPGACLVYTQLLDGMGD